MKIWVIDAETFYINEKGGEKYSLSLKGKDRMSTVDYVTDTRWHEHGWAVLDPDDKASFLRPAAFRLQLSRIRPDDLILAHNWAFDGLALRYHYGFRHWQVCDTMLLANVVLGTRKDRGESNSLGDLAEELNLPYRKGDLSPIEGKRELTEDEWDYLALYAKGDVRICKKIYEILMPQLNNAQSEIWLMQHSLNLFINRPVCVNAECVAKATADLQAWNKAELDKVMMPIPFAPEGRSVLTAGEYVRKNRDKVPNLASAERFEWMPLITDVIQLSSELQFSQILEPILKQNGMKLPRKQTEQKKKKPAKPKRKRPVLTEVDQLVSDKKQETIDQWEKYDRDMSAFVPGTFKTMIPAFAKADFGFQKLLVCGVPIVEDLCRARVALKSGRTIAARLKGIQADVAHMSLVYHGAGCLTGEAEVLTESGWRRLDEWAGGRIMQWEPDGTLRFSAASANVHVTQEPMLRLDHPRAGGVFTAGHTVPYFTSRGNFHTAKAGDRPGGYIHTSGLMTSGEDRWKTKLAVAIQADGHWCDKRSGCKLRFHLSRPRKIRRIQVILRRLGVSYDLKPYADSSVAVLVRKHSLPAWLPYGRKSFVDWKFTLNPAAVIRELPHWDGSYEKRYQAYEYSSCDRESAEWVQTYAHVSGYYASVKTRPQREGWAPSHRVYIGLGTRISIRSGSWKPASYQGSVYCPTTKTGYFLYRYRGQVLTTGNTGRWTGGGNGWNPQNIPSPSRAVSEEARRLSIALRSCLVPKPGYTFVHVDLAQAEARVVAWMAGQWDLVKKFEQGVDVYCEFIGDALGIKVTKPADDDKSLEANKMRALRAVGKEAILGLGFGMGKYKFHARLRAIPAVRNFLGPKLDDAFAEKLVNAYRERYTEVVGFWKLIDKAFHAARRGATVQLGAIKLYPRHNGESVWLQYPNGRRVPYSNLRQIESKHGGYQWVSGSGKKIYGGLLTENAVQGVARDILALAIYLCEAAGYRVVLTIHDAIILEVKSELAAEALAFTIKTLRTPPVWGLQLVLDAEGGIGSDFNA